MHALFRKMRFIDDCDIALYFCLPRKEVLGCWIVFLIMTSIRSIVTSSRCGDEAFLAKMYLTHICRYPVFAVKGLVNIWKSVNSNQTRWLFLPTWKNVGHSTEYVKLCQLCNTFQFASESQNIHRMWPAMYLFVVLGATKIEKRHTDLYLRLLIRFLSLHRNICCCVLDPLWILKCGFSWTIFLLGGNTFGNDVHASSKMISIFHWSHYLLRPMGEHICYYRNRCRFSLSYP